MEKKEEKQEEKQEMSFEEYQSLSDIDKAILENQQMLQGLIGKITAIKGISVELRNDGMDIEISGSKNKTRKAKLEAQFNAISVNIAVLQHIQATSYSLDPGFNLLHVGHEFAELKIRLKKENNLDYMLIPDNIAINDLAKVGKTMLQVVTAEVRKGNKNAGITPKVIADFVASFVAVVKEGKQVFTAVSPSNEASV